MENLLIAFMEDEAAALAALQHLMQGQINYLRAIRDAGALPIFFESGATPPLLPPALFETIEAPLLRLLFDAAYSLFGERPPCIIGGNAAPIASDFLPLRPGHVIAPSETDQEAFIKHAAGFPETHVRINMSTAVFTPQRAAGLEQEVERVLRLADKLNNVSIGCGVVPFDAGPEIVLRIRDLVESRGACTIH